MHPRETALGFFDIETNVESNVELLFECVRMDRDQLSAYVCRPRPLIGEAICGPLGFTYLIKVESLLNATLRL